MGSIPLGEGGPLRVRAFFGLPLPEEHRQALDRHLAGWAAAAPQFRWTPAANLHLTIRFLGQVDQPLAEGIAERLEDRGLKGFDLQLGKLGTFKRGRLARVVWLGQRSGGDDAMALAADVEEECVRAGLEPEARRFNAHLTLARARARDGAALPQLSPPPELAPWRAAELILFRSHLGRAGSVYEPLRRIRLS
ncbi:MAG TPA: RNA 2',3'-cyclic phosphodiesterase [Candidatus Dormibacteraeota bacterium]